MVVKTTETDPVIAELHAVRDEHAARFEYDIGAIFEDIRATQKALGRKCVKLPARRPGPAPSPSREREGR